MVQWNPILWTPAYYGWIVCPDEKLIELLALANLLQTTVNTDNGHFFFGRVKHSHTKLT